MIRMIVSASYRTDIPAFFGDWFLNRLRAGYCKVVNPYGGQVHRVNLDPEAVDGFVFWTKNGRPFLGALREVKARGQAFVVQYGINNYPRKLERAVPPAKQAIEDVKQIADQYGPRAVVWRYDTIVYSTFTPRESHLRNFYKLAAHLQGTVDEVVVSFAQTYRKTVSNMGKAGISWEDPPTEEKRSLLRELANIAKAKGMQLSVCSQRHLRVEGVADAKCIDPGRLQDLGGIRIDARRKGNRVDCGCYESRDIGAYDTCPMGCAYCYAVRNADVARRRLKEHDPQQEFLTPR